jgi:signal transduction histidine kinase
MDRAQELADRLVTGLWQTLITSRQSDLPTFTISATGSVVFPSEYVRTPAPRLLEGDELSNDQQVRWRAIRNATSEGTGSWQAFLGLNPPSNYAAVAHYAIGLHLLETDQPGSAADHLLAVARQYPEAAGETGLPLQPLAEFKLLTLTARGIKSGIGMEDFCSNVVHRPTLLTPYLLGAARELTEEPADRQVGERWLKLWAVHEMARRIGEALWERSSAADPLPLLSWVTSAPPGAGLSSSPYRWLVVQTQEEEGARRFICCEASDLDRQISAAVPGAFRIPAYFAVKVAVAGQEFPGITGQAASSPASEARVMATSIRREGTLEALRVTVFLADRNALFKRQRIRSFWFGSLIVAAAVAALIGVVGTWRAYAKQRRLNELKSNFVSSVSHELRAPIASVRLMAESLDRGKITDPAKQRDYFRFISQECRRLSALIENVLDFARIEQGRKQYEFEAADLGALVRNTITLMEPCAAEREVRLALQLPTTAPDGLPVTVDAKALQQALVNLVDNAIKHSAPGSVVTLGLAKGDPLCLWVEDHGPGIPAEDHARIFERFYRRGSELRRETQGVGIGLSIVKHIVEAHRGRIHVRSAVGQGSRFTIELPARTLTTDP